MTESKTAEKSDARRTRMRASLVAVLAVAIIVSSTGVCIAESDALAKRGWFQRMFMKPSWEQAVAECETARDVCRMVQRHVVYVEEDGDVWTAARDTWARGAGDCEDFAILIQDMCRELGIDSSVELHYSIAPVTAGHAVLVGKTDNTIWVSSNGNFKALRSEDAAKKYLAGVMRTSTKRMYAIAVTDEDVLLRVNSGLTGTLAATTPTTTPAPGS